jgi:predicted aconitase with swiveling domain
MTVAHNGETGEIPETLISEMTRDERLIAYGGVTTEIALMQMEPDFAQKVAEGDTFAINYAAAERAKAQLDSTIGDISRTAFTHDFDSN